MTFNNDTTEEILADMARVLPVEEIIELVDDIAADPIHAIEILQYIVHASEENNAV